MQTTFEDRLMFLILATAAVLPFALTTFYQAARIF